MSVSGKRNAKIEITSSAAGMDKGIADARRKLKTLERDQIRSEKAKARAEKVAAKERRKTIGGVTDFVKAGVGFAIGDNIAGALGGMVTDVFAVEKALTRLQITGGMTTGELEAFRAETMKVSNATGVSRSSLLEGATAYVAITGDAKTAKESLQLFAEVAAGSGSSMADIAKTAAALKQNMKIDPKDFRAAMDVLTVQGHKGSVEISDLSSQLATIAPQWADFAGGTGVKGLTEMGAALQMGRRGFGGDASETVTAAQGMLTAFKKHAGKFEGAGVKIFNVDKKGVKTMRNVLDIVDDISKSPLAKDPTLLNKAFGRIEGERFYEMLVKNRQELQGLIAESTDSNQVAKDNATWQESTAGKLAKAWETVKNSIAEAMTPERMKEFADAMMDLANSLTKVVQAFSAVYDAVTFSKKKEAKRFSDADVAAGSKLSVPEKLKRIKQLHDAAMDTSGDNPFLDEGVGFREGKAHAAKALTDQLPIWDRPAASSIGKVDAKAIGEAVVDALRASPIGIKIGSDPLVKGLGGAQTHRTRPGGR